MRVYPLSEGSFTIDHTKRFIPFDQERHRLQDRPSGSLMVEIQPFVVLTNRDVILLDTGLGFTSATGNLQLFENLQRVGVSPSSVTKVLLSHLHKDHAGGATIFDEQLGQWKPCFPSAQYHLQRAELDYAFSKAGSSYQLEELEVLQRMENLVLHDEEGIIDGYITFQRSGGHCPFHQVFWIREAGSTLFYGGDEAPQLQQMKSRFMAKYDYDGRKAMELRQKWWAEGKGWTFLFYHDVRTPFFKQDPAAS